MTSPDQDGLDSERFKNITEHDIPDEEMVIRDADFLEDDGIFNCDQSQASSIVETCWGQQTSGSSSHFFQTTGEPMRVREDVLDLIDSTDFSLAQLRSSTALLNRMGNQPRPPVQLEKETTENTRQTHQRAVLHAQSFLRRSHFLTVHPFSTTLALERLRDVGTAASKAVSTSSGCS